MLYEALKYLEIQLLLLKVVKEKIQVFHLSSNTEYENTLLPKSSTIYFNTNYRTEMKLVPIIMD